MVNIIIIFRNNSDLEVICLNTNNIDSLDGQFWESVEKNTKLGILDIASNRLTKLPESLRNCIRLTNLIVSKNKITSLSEILKNVHKLEELDVAKNQINKVSCMRCCK